jgi:mono/diheme cytochrome c family protein
MRMKVLRWSGYVLGGLIVVLAFAVAAVYFVSAQKLGNGYEVIPDAIAIPTDEASIARGRHIAEAMSDCVGCHTENLGGQMFLDDPNFARLAAPNLTSGQGGVGGNYSDEDWVRAIRHGVAADGRALIVMPSHWFHYLQDEDLGALIAYLKTVPPVDNQLPPRSVAFVPTRILLALGVFPTAVELIAKNGARPTPEAAVSVAYGGYISLVAACRECHGNDLAGGTSEGAPKGPNLTPGGAFAAYREEDFLKLMHSGVTPGGRAVSEEMPWINYGKMTDDELKALFAYLQSVEPLPNAGS